MKTIKERVAALLLEGFEGTPCDFSMRLGLMPAQCSRALRSFFFDPRNDWLGRVATQGTHRYELIAPVRPARAPRRPVGSKAGSRRPVRGKVAPRRSRSASFLDLPEHGWLWT